MNNLGLIFLGPPGAGKGTQAAIVAESFGIPHISTGEILREAIHAQSSLGQEAQSYVEKGELVPDRLLLDLIRDRLAQSDAAQGWILDGFPRNVGQAQFLDLLLTEINFGPSYVLNLDVPDQFLKERLLLRGREDDNESTINRRLEVYRLQTAPVIDYYQQQGNLHQIDGNRPADEVTSCLQSLISEGLNSSSAVKS